MKKIEATIVADSINSQGDRITTFLLTYPRFIHSELMTHRMFSRNSASSRAIPFEKMVKMVEEDPFIPIAWQKDHKGMQGTEYLDFKVPSCTGEWLRARSQAVRFAKELNTHEVTKQLCNRLLEPFMWHTVLVTATEFENFFNLRCPKYRATVDGEQVHFASKKELMKHEPHLEELCKLEWLERSESGAEIHIQALAEAMWDAQNESKPKELKAGEWHIPFGNRITATQYYPKYGPNEMMPIKIATARCARLSYMTFDGEIDYTKDIALHDQLLASGHMSPFEHCARAMSEEEYVSFVKGNLDTIEIDEPNDGEVVAYNKVWNHDKEAGWCNNFKGFIQYRYLVENNV